LFMNFGGKQVENNWWNLAKRQDLITAYGHTPSMTQQIRCEAEVTSSTTVLVFQIMCMSSGYNPVISVLLCSCS
jgi:hypothetical protein